MVAVLRYVLTAEPQVLADFLHKQKNTSGKAATREKDAASGRALFLSHIIRVPRNDVFLTQQLRDLTPAEVEVRPAL